MKEAVLEGDSFILLADFWDSFRVLEVRNMSAEGFITGTVQPRMYDALRAAIPNVNILSIEQLRSQAEGEIKPQEFVACGRAS
jgi:hypothetical protein